MEFTPFSIKSEFSISSFTCSVRNFLMNTNYTDRITKTHIHMLEFLYYILIISVIFLNYIFS